MIPQELKKQIEKLKLDGKDDSMIKRELTDKGWPRNLIEQTLKEFPNKPSTTPIDFKKPMIYANGKNLSYPPDGNAAEQKSDEPEAKSSNYFDGIVREKRKFKTFLVLLALAIITGFKPVYAIVRYGLPLLDNLERKVINLVEEVIPPELEVKIEKGQASSNVTEPYYLTTSYATLSDFVLVKQDEKASQVPVRLLTIDTKGSAEDFEKYQSLTLLTSKGLVYFSDNRIQIIPLSDVPDATITQETVKEIISGANRDNKLVDTLKLLVYISPVLIILINTILLFSRVSFISAILWVVSKIMKINVRFGILIKLSTAIYAVPYLLIAMTKSFLPVGPLRFWLPMVLNISVLVFGFITLRMHKKNSAA